MTKATIGSEDKEKIKTLFFGGGKTIKDISEEGKHSPRVISNSIAKLCKGQGTHPTRLFRSIKKTSKDLKSNIQNMEEEEKESGDILVTFEYQLKGDKIGGVEFTISQGTLYIEIDAVDKRYWSRGFHELTFVAGMKAREVAAEHDIPQENVVIMKECDEENVATDVLRYQFGIVYGK